MMYNFMRPGGVSLDCPSGGRTRSARRWTWYRATSTTGTACCPTTRYSRCVPRASACSRRGRPGLLGHRPHPARLRGQVRRSQGAPVRHLRRARLRHPVGSRATASTIHGPMQEMDQSRRIILQAVDRLEQTQPGDLGKAPKVFKPCPTTPMPRSRGRRAHWASISRATAARPYRPRSARFLHQPDALPMMLRGWKIATLIPSSAPSTSTWGGRR